MKKTILIADDETDILRIMSLRMEQYGYKVLTAQNGKETLRKVKKENPDLVLLDVMMPDINGFDLCKELRESKFQNKIVIYTAKVDAINATKARLAGADGFTVKTTIFDAIIESVEELLD